VSVQSPSRCSHSTFAPHHRAPFFSASARNKSCTRALCTRRCAWHLLHFHGSVRAAVLRRGRPAQPQAVLPQPVEPFDGFGSDALGAAMRATAVHPSSRGFHRVKRLTKLWKCNFGASALFYHRRRMESCSCVSSRAALLRACGLDGAALVEAAQLGTGSSGRALAGSV
jgi:hypothetical protein